MHPSPLSNVAPRARFNLFGRPSSRWFGRPLAGLLLAALVAPGLAAQDGAPPAGTDPAPAKPNGPQIRVSVDQFNFGSVPPGTTVHGTLEIESVGAAALLVSRIGVQCECARLHLSMAGRPNIPIDAEDAGRTDLTLQPGEKATLEIRVDTTKLPTGNFSKRCLVFCSDPAKSPLSIPFSVDVEKAKPAPAPAVQGAPKPGEAGGPAHADPDAEEERRPPPTPILGSGPPGKIEVDNYVHCFGETFRGEKLDHTFMLKNSGTGDLTIQEIRNSCSCTAARLKIGDKTLTQEEIKRSKNLGTLKPGESAELSVELKTASAAAPGHDLPIKKFVRIFSNDPTNFSLALARGDDGHPVHARPGRARPRPREARRGGGLQRAARRRQARRPQDPRREVAQRGVRAGQVREGRGRPDADLPHRGEAARVRAARRVQQPDRARHRPRAREGDLDPDARHRRAVRELRRQRERRLRPHRLRAAARRPGRDRGARDHQRRPVPYLLKTVTVDAKPSSDAFKTEIVEVEKGVKYVVSWSRPSRSRSRASSGQHQVSAEHPTSR
jgi:hypothetical protein